MAGRAKLDRTGRGRAKDLLDTSALSTSATKAPAPSHARQHGGLAALAPNTTESEVCGHKLSSPCFLDHDGGPVSQHSKLFSVAVISNTLIRKQLRKGRVDVMLYFWVTFTTGGVRTGTQARTVRER